MADEGITKLRHNYAGTRKFARSSQLKGLLRAEAELMASELRAEMAVKTGTLKAGVHVETKLFKGKDLTAQTAYVVSRGAYPGRMTDGGLPISHGAWHEFDKRAKTGGEMRRVLERRKAK